MIQKIMMSMNILKIVIGVCFNAMISVLIWRVELAQMGMLVKSINVSDATISNSIMYLVDIFGFLGK